MHLTVDLSIKYISKTRYYYGKQHVELTDTL